MTGWNSNRHLPGFAVVLRSVKGWIPLILVAAALLWTAGSTLAVYPHQLAYFNELAGGPEHGHRHLLGSNVQWGQDLLLVQEWIEASAIRPGQVGFVPPGFCPASESVTGPVPPSAIRPWEIVSADEVLDDRSGYPERMHGRRTERIGYGMWVFLRDEADARNNLGP